MDTTASSFSTRSNAKRAAEQMIAKGTAPSVDYRIKPRDNGRLGIVWKTAPTTGVVESKIAAAAAENGHSSTRPRLSINSAPSHPITNAEAVETAADTPNEPLRRPSRKKISKQEPNQPGTRATSVGIALALNRRSQEKSAALGGPGCHQDQETKQRGVIVLLI